MSNPNLPPSPTSRKPQKKRITKAEAEALQRFEAKIARLLALAGPPIDFVDTVAISTFLPVPPEILAELERINPGKVIHEEGKWQERYRGPLLPPYQILLPSILRIHQPSLATYKFLVKRFPDHKVSRLDFAVNYPTKFQADADLIDTGLIRKHVIMAWRRADWEVQEYEHGGTYYRAHESGDPPQRGRDILAYVTLSKKITDPPAAHFDCRFFSAETCGRLLGIHTAQDLIDLVDRRPLIRRHNRIADIRWDHAAKLLEKEVQKHARRFRAQARRSRRPLFAAFATAAAIRRRLEYVIARQLVADDPDPDIPAADLPTWDAFRDYPAQRLLDADFAGILRKSAIILPVDRIV